MTPFTCNAEDLYFRYDDEHQNCLDFVRVFYEHNWLQSLYWPSRGAAPWHLQMKLNDQLINFWPHKMKAHVANESSTAHGIEEIVATVLRIQNETLEDFDLVEKEQ